MKDYRMIAPAVLGSSKDCQTILTSCVANTQPYARKSAPFKTCEDSLLTLISKDYKYDQLVKEKFHNEAEHCAFTTNL